MVETDPAFTNKKNFLSSDYMFDQLSWDPDHRMKRLGDGFYEQTLINQQILNQTGKRYLTGYSNNEAEYKALMNAGLVYAKQLGLTPGVALTAEQMAALTSDMVWLEETTVMVNGEAQRVLYPKVYLANGGAISLDTEGNLMSGSTVIIQNVQELVNSGTITGDAVVVRATDITNSGVVVGGQVGLQADQDVTNTGNIQGESKVTILAGRDIHILSEVTDNAHHDVVAVSELLLQLAIMQRSLSVPIMTLTYKVLLLRHKVRNLLLRWLQVMILNSLPKVYLPIKI